MIFILSPSPITIIYFCPNIELSIITYSSIWYIHMVYHMVDLERTRKNILWSWSWLNAVKYYYLFWVSSVTMCYRSLKLFVTMVGYIWRTGEMPQGCLWIYLGMCCYSENICLWLFWLKVRSDGISACTRRLYFVVLTSSRSSWSGADRLQRC
jgi:hypothetical protein